MRIWTFAPPAVRHSNFHIKNEPLVLSRPVASIHIPHNEESLYSRALLIFRFFIKNQIEKTKVANGIQSISVVLPSTVQYRNPHTPVDFGV